MKISVIIPTYKPKAYLWECLDSLVAQTFPKQDFEVILVLNGCCEPWKGEIEQYIASRMQGMQVNFIHTDQGGVSNARNIALDQVRGEYVTFIDDDDLVSPCYLACLYEKVSPDTVSLCYPYAFNDGEMESQLPYSMTEVYDEMFMGTYTLSSKVRKFFSGPCMKLIPMSFIQDRRFDLRFKNGEDTLFMFLISDKINMISFASRDAIYYRRYREGSAVMVKRRYSDVFKSNLLQIGLYFKYYFCSPLHYSLYFFITRVGGSLYAILRGI